MPEKKNYDRLVKGLQIAAGVFMLAMAAAIVCLMAKYRISVKNADQIAGMLTGGAFTVALLIIAFSVVKSFALIFPPAVIYAVAGIFFERYLAAVLVNCVATALSLVLPYYLGRFTGKGMMETLKKRFPKIAKLDAFAGENQFALVFVIKASGMLPCDLSSLLFGAMDMPFGKYFLAANLGMLPLNLLWTLLGNKGDLSNPLSFLYVLPILVFAVAAAFAMKRFSDKHATNRKTETTEREEKK
ncbi:MAG: VTT domain-containing protein [Clostridia bacterium]|nr:VTT domain-containing protein [Clostridia bacterium]